MRHLRVLLDKQSRVLAMAPIEAGDGDSDETPSTAGLVPTEADHLVRDAESSDAALRVAVELAYTSLNFDGDGQLLGSLEQSAGLASPNSAPRTIAWLTPVDEPVSVEDYNRAWEAMYDQESEQIRSSLHEVMIEHFGCTAVPGLAGKPVIDILIGVTDWRATGSVRGALMRLGYEEAVAAETPERLYFRKRGGQAFNVNVVLYKGPLWKEYLMFREYLRSNPIAAQRYADVKRRAATDYPHSAVRYAQAKESEIHAILAGLRRRDP